MICMPAAQQWSAALWGIGVGIASVIGVWLVVAGAWFRKPAGDTIPVSDTTPEPLGEVHDYPEGLAEAHGPVPIVLKVTIVLFIIWTVGYVAWYFYAGPGL